MRFAKGHGTENDFVILPDPDGTLSLSAASVAALCDRRAGIGGDGVLRVVRTKAFDEPLTGPAASSAECEWFMDYRNADGSVAEMCGNGVRVFARYLLSAGLLAETSFGVGTRAGTRQVTVHEDSDITVDMGPVGMLGRGTAVLGGAELTGERVSVGNPHLACRVAGPVAGVDLGTAPVFDAAEFPQGANLEVFCESEPGVLDMRVYERGAAETRSCGTGIVAAAAAASGPGTDAQWTVRVPGGTCTVALESGSARLRGPAVIVAEGDIRLPG
ncbi:diaminopimelate epimerase [Nocardiopsis ansamitocini]|uniref:Diaminopimelate epimerase n=1 Tax=Nocardiopsis ansamitocini TaxID=1670832 RepID=A0A9W6UG22_9ACTN|nr:diaminopimelate epimerase [Nocardiopsis ansamitocini]GLU46396.1 diaminopimelate epimerase [Nocardiopsis ansamitocini]